MSIIKANAIKDAMIGRLCPYCGIHQEKLANHIYNCAEAQISVPAADLLKDSGYKYAYHPECGDVMILDVCVGLVLIEGSEGRYVVPASSLKCGGIADVVKAIEDAKLSDGQIQGLIQYLSNGDNIYNADLKELAVGGRVMIKLNGASKTGTVSKIYNSHQYIIDIDGGPTVNVSREKIENINGKEWRH